MTDKQNDFPGEWLRTPFEKSYAKLLRGWMEVAERSFTEVSSSKLAARMVEGHMLKDESEEGTTLACGAAYLLVVVCGLVSPQTFVDIAAAYFDGIIVLLRRVCPSPLPVYLNCQPR